MQEQPATVSRETKQVGEARDRWSWAEATVWTDRMLTTLERGVKGGKWYSLIDKVYAESNLRAGWRRVRQKKGSGGIDGQSVSRFLMRADREIERIEQELKRQTYRPKPVRRTWIPKPGSREKRPLGIPTIRDRVVQSALRHVIEPIFEAEFAEQSYGFRPGRGTKDALRRVNKLLEGGYTWVVDADLKSYFDTIPHDKLMDRVKEKIADSRLLGLIEGYLKQGVMESMKGWEPTEEGTPQGAVISPILANLYLNELDHKMVQGGWEIVRYADDFVILCQSRQEAEKALKAVQEWTAQAGLTLHPEKTHIVEATERGGFDFLGYHFERGLRWPRKKSLHKLKDTVRRKTRRNNPKDLQAIVNDLNATLHGWFNYFKHSHRTTFRPIDSWIRARLRSILRRRRKRKGIGRGRDHNRWPNAFFAAYGLLFLEDAHKALRQSR